MSNSSEEFIEDEKERKLRAKQAKSQVEDLEAALMAEMGMIQDNTKKQNRGSGFSPKQKSGGGSPSSNSPSLSPSQKRNSSKRHTQDGNRTSERMAIGIRGAAEGGNRNSSHRPKVEKVEKVEPSAEEVKESLVKEQGMAVAIDVESYEEQFNETKEEKRKRKEEAKAEMRRIKEMMGDDADDLEFESVETDSEEDGARLAPTQSQKTQIKILEADPAKPTPSAKKPLPKVPPKTPPKPSNALTSSNPASGASTPDRPQSVGNVQNFSPQNNNRNSGYTQADQQPSRPQHTSPESKPEPVTAQAATQGYLSPVQQLLAMEEANSNNLRRQSEERMASERRQAGEEFQRKLAREREEVEARMEAERLEREKRQAAEKAAYEERVAAQEEQRRYFEELNSNPGSFTQPGRGSQARPQARPEPEEDMEARMERLMEQKMAEKMAAMERLAQQKIEEAERIAAEKIQAADRLLQQRQQQVDSQQQARDDEDRERTRREREVELARQEKIQRQVADRMAAENLLAEQERQLQAQLAQHQAEKEKLERERDRMERENKEREERERQEKEAALTQNFNNAFTANSPPRGSNNGTGCAGYVPHSFRPNTCKLCFLSKDQHGGGDAQSTPTQQPQSPQQHQQRVPNNAQQSPNQVVSGRINSPVQGNVVRPQFTQPQNAVTVETCTGYAAHSFKPNTCKFCGAAKERHTGSSAMPSTQPSQTSQTASPSQPSIIHEYCQCNLQANTKFCNRCGKMVQNVGGGVQSPIRVNPTSGNNSPNVRPQPQTILPVCDQYVAHSFKPFCKNCNHSREEHKQSPSQTPTNAGYAEDDILFQSSEWKQKLLQKKQEQAEKQKAQQPMVVQDSGTDVPLIRPSRQMNAVVPTGNIRLQYSVQQLKNNEALPQGVDPLKKETYLSNIEFEATFKMTKTEFQGLPQWKQLNLKKSVGLH